ncbi:MULTISPECIES: N-acetylmuramoyl-L-alanine amidase [unclassified Streptomyces]|uniref:N-acetylmuramoyl-L-alanine amidase n=1 Tax=unclassified Streptomyces TaxID=2593676 RepID=UPI000DAB420F|nr:MULTISPECIES: N-acetylmuramoyl-L-alanine amidase [unclassified Streptomyces]PZT72740.1 N-acetylmuramoyl-L-alanine amidase [Streptomyces sp. AC1-42T]PZT80941.1 N-acetylmuramoyl-L-alanine amidase [Streptomyces sp. AC1-42W]
MWPHRIWLGAAVLPLALLVPRDAPVPHILAEPPRTASHPRAAAAPQPVVVSRAAWHADESIVREHASYTGAVRAVFIHHTGETSDYDCAEAPELIRNVEEAHINGRGWDDIGYNFLVDRCGTIYEGRAGGITRSVRGAHTTGFNADSVGIAVLGDYHDGERVPAAVVRSLAALAAWKLLPGEDPRGKVRLRSTNDASRYPKGEVAVLNVISGHRDTYSTRCPGQALYDELPEIRSMAAAMREAAGRDGEAATEDAGNRHGSSH